MSAAAGRPANVGAAAAPGHAAAARAARPAPARELQGQPARLRLALAVPRRCSWLSLLAELIANDRPLLVRYQGAFYFPVLVSLPRDRLRRLPADRGRLPRSARAGGDRGRGLDPVAADPATATTRSSTTSAEPAPSPPSSRNLAGHRRPGARRGGPADLRLSHLGPVRPGAHRPVLDRRRGRRPGAGLSSAAGSTWSMQRFIEIWSGLPTLFLLIILSSIVVAELLVAAGPDAAVLLDRARRPGPRRDAARPQLRLRPRRPRAGCRQRRHHVAPRAAQRPGLDADLHAVHPDRLGHDADRARLPRLRPAARLAVAGRAAVAGQEQPHRALARHHRASSRSR